MKSAKTKQNNLRRRTKKRTGKKVHLSELPFISDEQVGLNAFWISLSFFLSWRNRNKKFYSIVLGLSTCKSSFTKSARQQVVSGK